MQLLSLLGFRPNDFEILKRMAVSVGDVIRTYILLPHIACQLCDHKFRFLVSLLAPGRLVSDVFMALGLVGANRGVSAAAARGIAAYPCRFRWLRDLLRI